MYITNGTNGGWLKRIVPAPGWLLQSTRHYLHVIVRRARAGDLLAILNLPSQREVRQLRRRLKRLETQVETLRKPAHPSAS